MDGYGWRRWRMSGSRYQGLGAIAGVSEWILRKRVEELEKKLGVPAPVESVEELEPKSAAPEPVELVKEGAPAAVAYVEELKRMSGAPEPVKPVVKKKSRPSSKLALALLAARKIEGGVPLTRPEAAAYLGLCTKTLWRWEGKGKGKLRRCPNVGRVRYLASDVLKLASARLVKED
jgi:hypothetical protein